MEALILDCAEAAGSKVDIVPVAQGEAPLVAGPEHEHLFRCDPSRARAAGMPVTPLVETAAKVLSSI